MGRRFRAHTKKSLALNEQWLPWLTKHLNRLGLEVVPSVANFVLARFPDVESAQLAYDALLEAGIITRLMKSYHLPESLRISVGLGEENEALIQALRQHFEKQWPRPKCKLVPRLNCSQTYSWSISGSWD